MKEQLRQSNGFKICTATIFFVPAASASFADLPNPGMQRDPATTALVVTDPQNDF